MIKTVLREIQLEALHFMVMRERSIISMKTGLGKTLCVLSYIDYLFECKSVDYVVVFAPKQAINLVWVNQIGVHTDFSYIYIEDVKSLLDVVGKVVLVSYSVIEKYYDLLYNLVRGQLVVYDEVHKLKSIKTKRYNYFIQFESRFKYCVGLSATPLLNSPLDLYGVVSVVDKSFFGSYSRFVKDFCKVKELRFVDRVVYDVVDFKNKDLLVLKLSSLVFVRFIDFGIKFHTVNYALTMDESRRYYIASEGVLKEDSIKGFAQRLHDLQRVVDGSIDVGGMNLVDVVPSKYLSYRGVIGDILSRGESVIIFTEYHYTLNLLKGLISKDFSGYKVYEISGKCVDELEEYPNILLMTVAGSESLNLRRYNHVIFYSVPFSVGVFIQLVGRITRLDSDYLGDLNVYIPDNDFTIDRYKYIMIMSNKSIIESLFGREPNLAISEAKKFYRKEFLYKYRKDLLWWFKSNKNVFS